MVPIYLPPIVVPHEVLDEERRIIQMEGWYHVNGIYYPSATNADRMRRLEAEKRVREAARRCAWCNNALVEGKGVEVAGEGVHERPCSKEFESFTEPAPLIPLEQQLRKSIELGRIRNDDLVEWGEWVDQDTPNERYEREMVRWGDLSSYERHTVEREPDGRLVGGYPF